MSLVCDIRLHANAVNRVELRLDETNREKQPEMLPERWRDTFVGHGLWVNGHMLEPGRPSFV